MKLGPDDRIYSFDQKVFVSKFDFNSRFDTLQSPIVWEDIQLNCQCIGVPNYFEGGTPLPTNNQDLSITNFSLTPNPANENVTLTMEKVDGSTQVEIRNHIGQLIHKFNPNQTRTHFSVENFTAGTYYISAYSNGIINTQTLVVFK